MSAREPTIDRVPVALAGRGYDVLVGPGLLDRAGTLIAPLLGGRRALVVADATVAALHGKRLTQSLAAAGVDAPVVEVPSGEASKSFAGLEALLDALLAHELSRGDLLVVLGGGVVGDLAGLAASLYKRGIDFVQVPTTLLAQVDSSVGGKTAIDTPRGKNLVGAFHQPRLVLADINVLQTLPTRELRAGYAEVLKYGLLGDAAFYYWLEADGLKLDRFEPDRLQVAVTQCVELKARIVAEDEREVGQRALLNLGHTFAHALEAETGFGNELLHGEAVAIGCVLAFQLSADLGYCSPSLPGQVEAPLIVAGLPTGLQCLPGHPFAADRLLAHMRQDKKAEGGRLTLVLARAIGDAFVAKDVDEAAVRDFLLAQGAV